MLQLFWPLCLILLAVGSPELHAQSTITRAEQIQAERRKKAAALAADELGRVEKAIDDTQRSVPRFLNLGPVHIRTGGISDQSSFAIGPELLLRSAEDNLRFRLGAAGSTRMSYTLRTGVVMPGLAGRQVSLAIDAVHSDFPRLEYYGSGANSSKSGRTDYRREDTSLDVTLAWRPARQRFTAGLEAAPLFVNIGPGTDDRFANAELRYGPGQAPGIDAQTDFIRLGSFFDLDLRDLPEDPHQGTRVVTRYRYFRDIDLRRHSFGRASADVQHHIGFLNRKRVVTLGAGTELSHHSPGQIVPFYLQPTLGGPDDLRGFRRYRFQDNNLVRFNAEYRWEVSAGFDMALFGDAGKVFDRPRRITLTGLETSGGFGLRFKSRSSVVMRIDTGFSREGFQIWLRFAIPS